MKHLLWTVIAAALLCACGKDFKPGTRIESPRILALQADRPYAHPGEDVTLTLLSANPENETLEWAFGTCTLPPSSTVDDCLDTLDGDLMRFAPEVDELQVSVPKNLLARLDAAQRSSALIGVVVVACPGKLRAGDTLNVPTRCIDDGGNALPIHDLEIGIKRLFVREQDRNENPVIERITWDGKSWPAGEIRKAPICEEDTFSIDDCSESLQRRIGLEVSARESGRDELGATFTEQVIVQFHSTHGLFRDPVRIAEDTDNRWVAQRPAFGEASLATLWFIARDDRGGVSWAMRRVRVR